MKIDKRIARIIPKNSNDNFIFNEKFVGHRDELLEKFSSNGDYYFKSDLPLFDVAQDHIEKYSDVINSFDGVALIHPFYASTRDLDMIIDDPLKTGEYQRYMFNLDKFFKENTKKTVLFDNLYSYLAFTSRLLEEGLVNSAVITCKNSGMPYDNVDMERVRFNELFVGGMYGGGCLDSAVESLRNNNIDIFGITDLSLKLPYFNRIENGVSSCIDKKKRMSLDKFLKPFI